MGATKSCSNGSDRMIKIATTPRYDKTLLKYFSPEPDYMCPWDLVSSITGVGPAEFV